MGKDGQDQENGRETVITVSRSQHSGEAQVHTSETLDVAEPYTILINGKQPSIVPQFGFPEGDVESYVQATYGQTKLQVSK